MNKEERWKKEEKQQRAFQMQHEEKQMDSFVVRFNEDERAMLEGGKKTLKQSKDSTALKQLATIGAFVLHDKKTAFIIDVIFNNSRKNKRTGIEHFE